MYSGCIRKYFDDMLLPASLMASSIDGSRTSQVAKLRLQKYLAGIPAAFSNSSNVSFLMPASLLVFRSTIMKDRDFVWTASTSSGIGKILLPTNYCAYPFYIVPVIFFVPNKRLALKALFGQVGWYWPESMIAKMVVMAVFLPAFNKNNNSFNNDNSNKRLTRRS